MKKICFAQMKGGTGKTTVTWNLASVLAENYKVLVIDVDPQSNLSSNLDFDIFEPTTMTIADILEDINTNPEDCVTKYSEELLPNLDFIPSTMLLFATEMTLYSQQRGKDALEIYMSRHSDFFEKYDYILFDTGPSMGIINQNAFYTADDIVLVADPSVNSVKGAEIFLMLWSRQLEWTNKKLAISGIVINNMERTNATRNATDYIADHEVFSSLLFESTIPHNTRFRECDEQNLPIQFIKVKKQQEESKAKAELAIRELIDEMFKKGVL